jgi:hypothetical protein
MPERGFSSPPPQRAPARCAGPRQTDRPRGASLCACRGYSQGTGSCVKANFPDAPESNSGAGPLQAGVRTSRAARCWCDLRLSSFRKGSCSCPKARGGREGGGRHSSRLMGLGRAVWCWLDSIGVLSRMSAHQQGRGLRALYGLPGAISCNHNPFRIDWLSSRSRNLTELCWRGSGRQTAQCLPTIQDCTKQWYLVVKVVKAQNSLVYGRSL